MIKTLLIAADVDSSLLERANADGTYEVVHRPVRSEEELAAIVGEAHVLVTRAYNKVTRRVIDNAPHLELIAQGTSGIDNIDLDRSEEHTSELQSQSNLVCRLLLEKKKTSQIHDQEAIRVFPH